MHAEIGVFARRAGIETFYALGEVSAAAVRSFGDGGYLDNKPFGHATDALRSRRGGVPSQRKLVFIEPAANAMSLEFIIQPPCERLVGMAVADEDLGWGHPGGF
mgnify:CR=1 FL=1